MKTNDDHVKTLFCHDLTSSGEGVCTLNGKKIFIDQMLPDEKGKCRISVEKKSYAKGVLQKILTPSANRRAPSCPYFEQCGGCQLMHLDMMGQLRFKEKRVQEAFSRIGGLSKITIHPVVASEKSLGYRNKIQVPTIWDGRARKMGFYAKRSHDVIEVKRCQLHHPLGDQLYHEIRHRLSGLRVTFYDEKRRCGEIRHIMIRTSSLEQKCLVLIIGGEAMTQTVEELCLNIGQLSQVAGVVFGVNDRKTNALLPAKIESIAGRNYLMEQVLDVQVHLSAPSFFQVNLSQAEKLYAKALQLGQVGVGTRVVDAYSGIGVLSCLLAKRGCHVTSIEIVQQAGIDAEKNATLNGVSLDIRIGKVEEILPTLHPPDVIYLNPPRKGCDDSVLKCAAYMQPDRIIYTSCDPATLARDAHILTSLGYEKIELYLYDFFPQTVHIETIALFQKSS